LDEQLRRKRPTGLAPPLEKLRYITDITRP
jgi:hypothetical protein